MKTVNKLKNTDRSRGLHILASFEAFKGLLVLIVGIGLLENLHGDLRIIANTAMSIFKHLHLNPARHYPHVLLTAIATISDKNIFWLAIGSLVYSTLRFIEAFGLWQKRTWAQWIAIISGSLYIPVEVLELSHGFSYLKASISLFNIILVIYLLKIRFLKLFQ